LMKSAAGATVLFIAASCCLWYSLKASTAPDVNELLRAARGAQASVTMSATASTAVAAVTAAASTEADLYVATAKPTITDAQVSLILLWVTSIAMFAYRKMGGEPTARHETDDERVAASRESAQFTEVLRSGVVFGGIMFYMWLLDDRQIFPIHGKHYSRDLFLFICLAILLWASSTVKQARKPRSRAPAEPKPVEQADKAILPPPAATKGEADWKGDYLGREQTEEWKGWMQIGFLLYHYFAAKEYYNLIRVLIASYVWMTGFGNFSYFRKTGDYSLWRVLKMLFRLNFLVFVMCLMMNTDYVLYYICPMHTLWFLSVYFVMWIKSDWNSTPHLLGLKMGVYFVIVATVWEIPAVFNAVFTPMAPLLSTGGSMHEWTFRTTLDHWATLVGMLWAWGQPWVKQSLEELEVPGREQRSFVVKGGILVGGFIVFYMWFTRIFLLPKYEYNPVHPYYSIIPILYYIYVRNLMPNWRKWHLGLLEQAGKITLETYLCQFHIWMCRRGDHYVGALIEIIPGEYHLVNFMLVTAIYILLSQRLFDLTTVFSSYLLGAKQPTHEMGLPWDAMKRRWGKLAGTYLALYAVVALYRNVMHGPLPTLPFGSMQALDAV